MLRVAGRHANRVHVSSGSGVLAGQCQRATERRERDAEVGQVEVSEQSAESDEPEGSEPRGGDQDTSERECVAPQNDGSPQDGREELRAVFLSSPRGGTVPALSDNGSRSSQPVAELGFALW